MNNLDKDAGSGAWKWAVILMATSICAALGWWEEARRRREAEQELGIMKSFADRALADLCPAPNYLGDEKKYVAETEKYAECWAAFVYEGRRIPLDLPRVSGKSK